MTDDKWFSTPKAARKRKPIELTLSAESIAWLTKEADRLDTHRSRLVEALIQKAMK